MKKVKLTQQQIDAMNKALDFCNGDTDYLIKYHRGMKEVGGKWTLRGMSTLNDLTPQELHDALKYGYEVQGKVKVSRLVAEAIRFVIGEGWRTEDILRVHKDKPHSWWRNGTDALNTIDYNTLKRALEDGYEVDEQLSSPKWKHVHSNVVELPKAYSHPQCCCTVVPVQAQKDNKTNLAPSDYASIIDIALMTGDKAWFDELHAKMREGATTE